MLEKIPSVVGEALAGLKAGIGKTAYHATFPDVAATLTLTSPAFSDRADLPSRFTADGPGLSPPLDWSGVPVGTAALALLVEDAGSPTPHPLVHVIAWTLAPTTAGLREGVLSDRERPDPRWRIGRNSFQRAAWLPPDPPSGHGRHAYLFQIYAIRQGPELQEGCGRGALLEDMRGRVVGKGLLTGFYGRP
jgi:Raf kinase inhibitor-like YbhB/YbcL family protein